MNQPNKCQRCESKIHAISCHDKPESHICNEVCHKPEQKECDCYWCKLGHKPLCWCDEAECKCGINPNPFALSHSRGISAGTHKPDSWEERLTELLDKVYGYIHQRGHKEIINQVSQLLDTTRQEGKNEILGGGRMKHFMETELDQAKKEAYQQGMDEAPVYVLESKIKEIKEKTLAEVKERVMKMEELHTHNSIPSYTADLDEGCIICLKNKNLEDLLSELK